jgi:NADPH-dependent 2,4-dienoyl-CoA reductase/sulfur reductase-like enzyme
VQLLIIGGSDAGISAGLRAREIDPDVDVALVLADQYPNFSICGLPFFLSGEVPDWHRLAHRSREEIERHGITVLTEHVAEAIETPSKEVRVRYGDAERTLSYDKLIVATGAIPIRPPIAGLETAGVYVLHSMDDSFLLNERLRTARSAVIIGAGYIGVEMADALTHRGVAVTLIERLPSVLTTVDPEFGALIETELKSHGVSVETNTRVDRIVPTEGGLRVSGPDGFDIEADIALVVVGVRPNGALASAASAMLGYADAVRVTPRDGDQSPGHLRSR